MAAIPSLDASSLAHALHGALSTETEHRQACEAVLAQWEAVGGFCSALLALYAAPPDGLGQPPRLLAVLCLKNAVNRRWHQRRQDEPAISDAEKTVLRNGLLHTLDEPDTQIWAQLEVVIATIGRLDGLPAWPELMPTLLGAASRPAARLAARGMSALYRVTKQQASRRLLAHRKQFMALAAELLPRLQPLRQAHTGALLSTLAQRSPEAAAAWLLDEGFGGNGGGGDSGAATLRVAVALCKLERQLLLHDTHLHDHPDACAVLGHSLELMLAAEEQWQRLAEATAAGVAGAEGAARALMPLLLIPAKMLMEVQDLQPLATTAILSRALTFFLRQLHARRFRPGDEDDDEKFLVRALMFLRNALSTSAYLPTARAPPEAHACHQVLLAFFASPSLPQLVHSLLTRALPLTPDEYDEYGADPEGFVYEEHLARETNSLRKCAERCLLTLAETRECQQPVKQAVLELSNSAAAAGLGSLDAILTLDSCYLGMGLVLQSGPDASQLTVVLSTLRQHCALAAAEHAHLLRRRAAWLIGWILKTPYFARVAQSASSGVEAPGDATEAISLMYSMLAELLSDGHPGVRLGAALAVQGLFDTTDTSPRADGHVSANEWRRGSFGMSEGKLAAGAQEASDPLARLASSALLPVLHLSLHVREIDSRWRMGQLLVRLLTRLASAPSLLAPQLPALTEWLPTAWSACEAEQLLQEATLDAADTMLLACPQPPVLPQPHLPLIAAGINLVALATAPGGADGTEPPPVGLVDLALKLWRSCVAAIRPPLCAELAPQLGLLAARLPALIGLGDELVRPAMLLVDWYVFADVCHGVCGGGFVAHHAAPLAPIFKKALTWGETGPGTLAAIASLHTFLLGSPAHAGAFAPALGAALACLVAPGDDEVEGKPNELMLAAMAVLLGRMLLVAPTVFSALLQQAAAELNLPDVHVRLGRAWVGLLDAIVLAPQRKLACLGLAALLPLDAALLPLAPEILSFCVGELAELNELAHGEGEGPVIGVPIPIAGEHAEFARRLAESALDPVAAVPLLPALRQQLTAVAAAHGESFNSILRELDPTILASVKGAFSIA